MGLPRLVLGVLPECLRHRGEGEEQSLQPHVDLRQGLKRVSGVQVAAQETYLSYPCAQLGEVSDFKSNFCGYRIPLDKQR